VSKKFTHRQLVKRTAEFLRKQRYTTVITELTAAANNEIPDVIGFDYRGVSVLVECKTSRKDFLQDQNKDHRQRRSRGMGNLRYYAAPAGVIDCRDLPDGWGLLTIDEKYGYLEVNVSKMPAVFHDEQINKRGELAIVLSALRRFQKISAAIYITESNQEDIRK